MVEQNTRAGTNQLPKRWIDADCGTVTMNLTKPRPRWSDDPTDDDCYRCWEYRTAGDPEARLLTRRMFLCPTCGNKRCPKASDHRLACTGSNAVGQEGSIYA